MEMIERVARALYERNPLYDQETGLDGCPTAPRRISWEQLIEYDSGHHEDVIEDVRAVITAMHEPTEAMIAAGDTSLYDPGSRLTWQAMIDAALKAPETAA